MRPASDHDVVFWTVPEVATILRVSRPIVDRLILQGRLPAAKVGGQYRIRSDDLQKWWDAEVKNTKRNNTKGCL